MVLCSSSGFLQCFSNCSLPFSCGAQKYSFKKVAPFSKKEKKNQRLFCNSVLCIGYVSALSFFFWWGSLLELNALYLSAFYAREGGGRRRHDALRRGHRRLLNDRGGGAAAHTTIAALLDHFAGLTLFQAARLLVHVHAADLLALLDTGGSREVSHCHSEKKKKPFLGRTLTSEAEVSKLEDSSLDTTEPVGVTSIFASDSWLPLKINLKHKDKHSGCIWYANCN